MSIDNESGALVTGAVVGIGMTLLVSHMFSSADPKPVDVKYRDINGDGNIDAIVQMDKGSNYGFLKMDDGRYISLEEHNSQLEDSLYTVNLNDLK